MPQQQKRKSPDELLGPAPKRKSPDELLGPVAIPAPTGDQNSLLENAWEAVKNAGRNYIESPIITLGEAIESAQNGDWGPLANIAESAGRGALKIVDSISAAQTGNPETAEIQTPAIQQLTQERIQGSKSLQDIQNRNVQYDEFTKRNPSKTAKVVRGASGLATAAAPVVATGLVSGGSVSAMTGVAALQSMGEPENLPMNVAMSVVPLPAVEKVAPIIQRIRGARGGAVRAIEQEAISPVGQRASMRGPAALVGMESPIEEIAAKGGSVRQALGVGADEALAQEAGTLVAAAERTPVLETITAVRKAGLLTSAKTHIRNTVGTGAFQISEEAARIPAAMADLVMASRSGRRSISGPSITAMGRSGYEAATKGISEAVEILKKGATAEELARLQLPKEIASGSPILDKYVNGVFRTLTAEDKVFRTYAFRRSLEDRAASIARNEIRSGTIPQGQYGQRVRELIEAPPPDLQAGAIGDAEIATFNNQNRISDFLQNSREWISGKPGGRWVNFAIDTVAPFTKTPTNILARMLDYSPYGLAKGSYQVAKATLKPVFTAEEQRAFAQTFGRGALGSAAIALGWKLGEWGLMTGLYEDEPSNRTRDQAIGRPPGSIKIGDIWYQVTGFAPLGNLLAIGASLAREYSEQREDTSQRIPKTLGIFENAAMEQPLLEGAANIVDTMRGRRSLMDEAGRMAGSFVPSLVSDIGQAIDPNQRQARGFAAQIENRIPGLRESLPVAADAIGMPLPDQGAVATMLDPTRSTRQDSAPILQELVRLDMGLSKIQKKKEEPEDLYRQKVTRFGALYQDFGNALLGNGLYQRSSDAVKKEALETLSNRVKAQIADELKNGRRAQNPRYRLSPNYLMQAVIAADREGRK